MNSTEHSPGTRNTAEEWQVRPPAETAHFSARVKYLDPDLILAYYVRETAAAGWPAPVGDTAA